MSESPSKNSGYAPSLWEDIDEKAPKYCPHCGQQLAHPDKLRENDEADAHGYGGAYRKHRQTHFSWGDDITDSSGKDPYLAKNYDNGTEPSVGGDDDNEIVAEVYDVTLYYEAVVNARVVAVSEHQAKERAEDLMAFDAKDLFGSVPTAERTHQLHDDVTQVRGVTRGEVNESEDIDEDEDDGINYAERLPGWPW